MCISDAESLDVSPCSGQRQRKQFCREGQETAQRGSASCPGSHSTGAQRIPSPHLRFHPSPSADPWLPPPSDFSGEEKKKKTHARKHPSLAISLGPKGQGSAGRRPQGLRLDQDPAGLGVRGWNFSHPEIFLRQPRRAPWTPLALPPTSFLGPKRLLCKVCPQLSGDSFLSARGSEVGSSKRGTLERLPSGRAKTPGGEQGAEG